MKFPLHGLLTAKRATTNALPVGAMLYDIRTKVAIPILRFFYLVGGDLTILVANDSPGAKYASRPILKDDLVLISYNRDLEGYPVADLVSQAERVSDLTRLAKRSETTNKVAMLVTNDLHTEVAASLFVD